MKKECVRFKQSVSDFPLEVSLDKKVPSWDLSRWRGDTGLRFVPSCDEGFSLRGDRQQLLYKGRKQSHRFTILNDSAFEYDCILLKEPESNIISLRMEGAEKYDFLRQPDFVRDEFLKGSYAVYKKETLIGEGTGKLCHIHRPKIFDARGLSCWGDLAVAGCELLIIIPEDFLSEAKYPVVVDPTVGTTTIGSQTIWYDADNEDYRELYFEFSIGVNRFLIPESFNKTATAYVYAYNRDYYGRCKPVLYSDNNNVPSQRRSTNENNFDIAIGSTKPAGWRSTTFMPSTSITSGSYIWFGLFCDMFYPHFDYGAKCYKNGFNDVEDDIPNTYPFYYTHVYYDLKLSMYFTYVNPQNYVRTLTQGVKLTDTRKVTASYQRRLLQTVRTNTVIKRINTIVRKCVMTVRNTMNLQRFTTFYRKTIEQIKINSNHSFMRSLVRKCVEKISIRFVMNRFQGIARTVQDKVKSLDSRSYPLLIIRNVDDGNFIYEVAQRKAEYIKQIETQADTSGETLHRAEYYRLNNDEVQTDGLALRSVLMVVKIVARLFSRDYFFFRFLKAKEELKLKSCITRELALDSKII